MKSNGFDATALGLPSLSDTFDPLDPRAYSRLARDLYDERHRYVTNLRYAFRPNKPRLTMRLAKTMMDVMLFGKRPLRYVEFNIGHACNFTCEHCFETAFHKKKKKKAMDIADFRSVAEQAMELGAVNFSFQGGEPLMYKDKLLKAIDAVYPDRNLISVTTNAWYLDEPMVLDLKDAGVDIFTISIDSGIAEEHDKFRGKPGSFERCMKGIDLSMKAGVNVTIGSTITHENIRSEGLNRLIRYAEEKDLILILILATPAGNWRDSMKYLLTKEDRKYLEEEIIAKHPLVRTDLVANFKDHGCGAAKEILYLTPGGEVLTCPFIHVAFGNVFDTPIKEIRERMLKQAEFKSFHGHCLIGEDHKFIKKYIEPTFGMKDLPLDYVTAGFKE